MASPANLGSFATFIRIEKSQTNFFKEFQMIMKSVEILFPFFRLGRSLSICKPVIIRCSNSPRSSNSDTFTGRSSSSSSSRACSGWRGSSFVLNRRSGATSRSSSDISRSRKSINLDSSGSFLFGRILVEIKSTHTYILILCIENTLIHIS